MGLRSWGEEEEEEEVLRLLVGERMDHGRFLFAPGSRGSPFIHEALWDGASTACAVGKLELAAVSAVLHRVSLTAPLAWGPLISDGCGGGLPLSPPSGSPLQLLLVLAATSALGVAPIGQCFAHRAFLMPALEPPEISTLSDSPAAEAEAHTRTLPSHPSPPPFQYPLAQRQILVLFCRCTSLNAVVLLALRAPCNAFFSL